METVYYQGSDAHQYLSELSLIDEYQTQRHMPPQLLSRELEDQTSITFTDGTEQTTNQLFIAWIDTSYLYHLSHRHLHLSLSFSACLLWIFACLPHSQIEKEEFACVFVFWATLLACSSRFKKIDAPAEAALPECYTGKMVRLLMDLRMKTVNQFAGQFSNQQIWMIQTNIVYICKQFSQGIEQIDSPLSPILLYNSIGILIKNMTTMLMSNSFDDQVHWKQIGNLGKKIVSQTILEFRAMLMYQKLIAYQQVLGKKLKEAKEKQSYPNRTDEIGLKAKQNFDYQLMQILHLNFQQLPRSSDQQLQSIRFMNKAILNLIKIQLLQKQASMCTIENIAQNPVLAEQEENKAQTKRAQSENYIQISTDGVSTCIEEQLIREQVESLKDRLDQIMEARSNEIQESNMVKNAQEKQNESMKRMHQESKFERRIEGFGNIFSRGNSAKMQQFYLE